MVRVSLPDTLIARLRDLTRGGDGPIVVGIDGRSGAGKSTLAGAIAHELASSGEVFGPATVIEGDQFYGGGSAETWDGLTPAERADRVIDWRRQRAALLDLRRHGVATWRAFDWDATDWDSDAVPLEADPVVVRSAPVIVLEGAYSCRPELHDLIDLRVLLVVPDEARRHQLLDREGDDHDADWDARWAVAEEYYFSTVMPPDRFDLVLGPEA